MEQLEVQVQQCQKTHKKESSMETHVGQLVWTLVKETKECFKETNILLSLILRHD